LVQYYPFVPVGTALAAALLYIFERRRLARYRVLAVEREGESLCTFVRTFPPSEREPYILRAVYEELTAYRRIGTVTVPLRPSDLLESDLGLDGDELDFAAQSISRRCGRPLTDAKVNPFYGRVKTIADLVHFFESQPRSNAA